MGMGWDGDGDRDVTGTRMVMVPGNEDRAEDGADDEDGAGAGSKAGRARR